MSNTARFTASEVSSLKIATAKNGKDYISGFLIDHNAEGGYATSKAFRSFDAQVVANLPVELKEFAAKSAEEQKAAKGSRPRISVEGWLSNKANAKGIWSETLMITAIL
jgi:hypothetical protein